MFRMCSVEIVPHEDEFFMYLCVFGGGRVIFLSNSSSILKVLNSKVLIHI